MSGKPNQRTVVPCRQCGDEVELDADSVARWDSFNAALHAARRPPIRGDEVAVCTKPECNEADKAEARGLMDGQGKN